MRANSRGASERGADRAGGASFRNPTIPTPRARSMKFRPFRGCFPGLPSARPLRRDDFPPPSDVPRIARTRKKSRRRFSLSVEQASSRWGRHLACQTPSSRSTRLRATHTPSPDVRCAHPGLRSLGSVCAAPSMAPLARYAGSWGTCSPKPPGYAVRWRKARGSPGPGQARMPFTTCPWTSVSRN